MRTCEYWQERISAFLDGELTGAERLELMEHLAQCDGCRALFEDLTAIHGAMAELEAAVPAGFAESVMEQVRRTGQDPVKKPTAFLWRRWAAAAACCALVFGGLWTVGGGTERNDSMSVVSYSAAITAAEESAPESSTVSASAYAAPAAAAESPDAKTAPAMADVARAGEESCTLPGDTVPTLLWEGARYVWAATADEIPANYGAVCQLEQAHTLTENGQFTADFAASGTVYDDPDTDHALYVCITTPWLEDAVVRFDRIE